MFHKELELAGGHVVWAVPTQASEGRVVEEDGKVARARGHDHITPVYCIWVCVSHVRTLVLCEGSAQVL